MKIAVYIQFQTDSDEYIQPPLMRMKKKQEWTVVYVHYRQFHTDCDEYMQSPFLQVKNKETLKNNLSRSM